MIENWIDQLAENMSRMYAGQGKNMLAYKMFSKTDMPESLKSFPSCINLPENVVTKYSSGGPCTNIWRGTTEFHITSDMNRKKLPEVILFFKRIRDQFAGNVTLDGSVAYCLLDPEGVSIEGPVEIRWGTENPHFGLIAHWIVKEVETDVVVE